MLNKIVQVTAVQEEEWIRTLYYNSAGQTYMNPADSKELKCNFFSIIYCTRFNKCVNKQNWKYIIY